MNATEMTAATKRKVFDATTVLNRDPDVDADEVVPAAAANTLPAMAAGDANAPMATAKVIVKRVVGPVRVRMLSTVSERLLRSISRPRARRCRTVSSLMSSVSATALVD